MGLAYYPDGAHDDVDELEPGVSIFHPLYRLYQQLQNLDVILNIVQGTELLFILTPLLILIVSLLFLDRTTW